MDIVEIQSVLLKLGERVPPDSSLILVGGSALALLGNQRQTVDIDFVGDDVNPTDFCKLKVTFLAKITRENAKIL